MLVSRVGKLQLETPIARFNEVLIGTLKFDHVPLNMLKHCFSNIFLVELTLTEAHCVIYVLFNCKKKKSGRVVWNRNEQSSWVLAESQSYYYKVLFLTHSLISDAYFISLVTVWLMLDSPELNGTEFNSRQIVGIQQGFLDPEGSCSRGEMQIRYRSALCRSSSIVKIVTTNISIIICFTVRHTRYRRPFKHVTWRARNDAHRAKKKWKGKQ